MVPRSVATSMLKVVFLVFVYLSACAFVCLRVSVLLRSMVLSVYFFHLCESVHLNLWLVSLCVGLFVC